VFVAWGAAITEITLGAGVVFFSHDLCAGIGTGALGLSMFLLAMTVYAAV